MVSRDESKVKETQNITTRKTPRFVVAPRSCSPGEHSSICIPETRAPAPRTTSRICVTAGPDSTTATPYVNTIRYAPSGLLPPAVFVSAPLIVSKAGKLTNRKNTNRSGMRGWKRDSWFTKRATTKRQFLPPNRELQQIRCHQHPRVLFRGGLQLSSRWRRLAENLPRKRSRLLRCKIRLS